MAAAICHGAFFFAYARLETGDCNGGKRTSPDGEDSKWQFGLKMPRAWNSSYFDVPEGRHSEERRDDESMP
jgi:hypothetical protein